MAYTDYMNSFMGSLPQDIIKLDPNKINIADLKLWRDPADKKFKPEKPVKEEVHYKYYPISELKSHLAESCFEDVRTMDTVYIFPDKSQKAIPDKIIRDSGRIPNSSGAVDIGYHPDDDFWYTMVLDRLIWSSKPVTTIRPQLNRYNALTLKKEKKSDYGVP